MDDTSQVPELSAPLPTPAAPEPVAVVPPIARRPAAAAPMRLSRMALALALLTLALFAPLLVGQFVYQISYNKLKAGYDVATGALGELKPRLNDLELASRMVAKRVEPSVVSIFRPGGRGREGQGSGVIVDPQGYVITNYHVVNGAEAIHVQLSDGRGTEASVVGADAMTDLAVLKIDLPNLIAAEWGDSDVLQVGDLVWALGSPYGLDQSLTFGVVSAKARRSGSHLTHSAYQEYLQTDAAVNPGNSGGPLVNIEGQVVGINAAIFGAAYQGISFAIPSTLAREKYEELRTKGWVDRAWLGVAPREVPELVRERLGLALGEGVYVGRVQPGAPAARAGIRRGDVILKWNEHQATDPTLLSRAIAGTEIGSMAKVTLARSDEETGSDAERLELDLRVERAPWSVPTSGQ